MKDLQDEIGLEESVLEKQLVSVMAENEFLNNKVLRVMEILLERREEVNKS
jgi:hypothetical protein